MDENEARTRYEQICELGNERDQFLDGWLRWLVVIATGGLSVLIPLSKLEDASPFAVFFFKATCICVGIGVLAIAIRIYAFHVSKKTLIRGLVKSMKEDDNGPVTSEVPKWMLRAEIVGYIFLILGLMNMIVFACLR